MSLELTGIVKAYGAQVALDGVDLTVPAGAIVALLGPNGAGKSTLISIAAGLLEPDAGTVRRASVGVAPQEIGVYPALTVRENLRAFGELHGLGARAARARAEALLGPFVLRALAGRAAGRLSGGEQRRLHAAIALVARPRVVLLDEPTAGADAQTRDAILDAVRDLAAEGVAVLYTTHYLPEVESLDADVALLDGGRIVACGPIAELVARHAPRPKVEIVRPSLEAVYRELTGQRG